MSNSQGCREVTERITASPHRPVLLCKRCAASDLFLLPWNKVSVKTIQTDVFQNTSFLVKKKGHFPVKSSSNSNPSSILLPPEHLPAGPAAPDQKPRSPRGASRWEGMGGGGALPAPPGYAAPSGRAARPRSPGGGDTPRPGPGAPPRLPGGPPAGGETGARAARGTATRLCLSLRPAPAPASPRDARPAASAAATPRRRAARPSRRQKPKPTAPGASPRLPPRAAHPPPPPPGCGEAAAGAAHLPAGRAWGRR